MARVVPHLYTSFGGVWLTSRLGMAEEHTRRAQPISIDTLNGPYIPSAALLIEAPTVAVRGLTLETADVVALRGMVGQTALLYRRVWDGTNYSTQRQYAQLLGIDHPFDAPRFYVIDVALTFQLTEPTWRGRRYTGTAPLWGAFDWGDGYQYGSAGTLSWALDAASEVIVLPNAGDLVVPGPKLTFAVPSGAAALTSLVISAASTVGVQLLTWTGSMTNNTLTFDCAAKTIYTGGPVGAWKNLAVADRGLPWLPIPVGGETLTLTITQSTVNMTLTAEYEERHA